MSEITASPRSWRVHPRASKAVLQARIHSLFDAIAHGDNKHRAWLRNAIEMHFDGFAVPPEGLPR
jgi:hypothetical protein